MPVRIQFLGSGNAFAAGGRSHACILLASEGRSLLLDCGGSALPAITRAMDPGDIEAIAVTHLHGDHFGGIPFLMDQRKWARSGQALVVGGPPALEERLRLVASGYDMDLSAGSLGFEVTFITLGPDPRAMGPALVSAHPVKHVASAQPHGLRVRIGGKLIAYSGDAAWTDDLIALADGADLFICEATYYAFRGDPVHLSALELASHRERLRCDRVILTHLGAEALEHRAEMPFDVADDGTALEL